MVRIRPGSQEGVENVASVSGRTLKWDYSGIGLIDIPTSGSQGLDNENTDIGASAGSPGNASTMGTEAGILQSIYNSIKELQTETRIESRRAMIATKRLQGTVRKVAKSCTEIEAKLCSMEERIVAVEKEVDTLKEQNAERDGQLTDVMSQDGDRVGRLSGELRLGPSETNLQGAPNREIGTLKSASGPGVVHGNGGPSRATQERGARERRDACEAVQWQRLRGLRPCRKKSGVPRCSRGGGKRPGAFGEGEAPWSEVRASVRLLLSPLCPLPPPADLSGQTRRASIAGRIVPANHTRGGMVEWWRCVRAPESSRTRR
ncbi:hypothetical protein NDU88_005631 [Pleurodeles waltl]|uniref:Uncharacterized protein n=1 Tax=Pleurodeles waltl TaxID=8319 RepID=A0AAV7LLN2_PLEWA|nr:hypothetical protein NDU88_005631 [Pleurodeles waltl]